jgi:hypothetical protein
VLFFAVSSKCRGAGKAKETTKYKWNESGTSNHFNSTEKELNAEKIFLKKSII